MTASPDNEPSPPGGEDTRGAHGEMNPDPFFAGQRRKRDIALVVFLVSSLAFGIADVLLYANTSWDSVSWILDTIIGVVAIASWCRYDAQQRGFVITGRLQLWIWLFALVAVPVYLVKSRGWAGAARLGFGAPVFLLSIGLYYAGWYGTYWLAEMTGYFD